MADADSQIPRDTSSLQIRPPRVLRETATRPRSRTLAQPLSAVTAAFPAPATQPPAPVAPRAAPATAGLGAASVLPSDSPYLGPNAVAALDPEVWLVAHAIPGGGLHTLEGEGRPGMIRVGRPYGHLRSLRPVLPTSARTLDAAPATPQQSTRKGRPRRGLGSGILTMEEGLASAQLAAEQDAAARGAGLPAKLARHDVVTAVEVETDTGVFRVERPGMVLSNSDLAWALAHLEAGEPDGMVPLPRRQLALLLTLLPTPEDPEHPERDPHWGWAHRLKEPWERGPLHPRGRLGRLIAVDPDLSGRGLHRACFEILGGDEVVWAHGVPCYRPGSVYELTPLRPGSSLSRWLSWPVPKMPRTRKKAAPAGEEVPAATGRAKRAAHAATPRTGAPSDLPTWEIARVVYRVGAPRWPLAGVVEPLGPLGTVG
jgi:hypothetical protein